MSMGWRKLYLWGAGVWALWVVSSSCTGVICGPGQRQVNHRCVQTCDKDSECKASEICLDGVCAEANSSSGTASSAGSSGSVSSSGGTSSSGGGSGSSGGGGGSSGTGSSGGGGSSGAMSSGGSSGGGSGNPGSGFRYHLMDVPGGGGRATGSNHVVDMAIGVPMGANAPASGTRGLGLGIFSTHSVP